MYYPQCRCVSPEGSFVGLVLSFDLIILGIIVQPGVLSLVKLVKVSYIVSSPLCKGGVEKLENVLKGGVEGFHSERGKISGRGRNI